MRLPARSGEGVRSLLRARRGRSAPKSRPATRVSLIFFRAELLPVIALIVQALQRAGRAFAAGGFFRLRLRLSGGLVAAMFLLHGFTRLASSDKALGADSRSLTRCVYPAVRDVTGHSRTSG